MARDRRKPASADKRRVPKKKTSILVTERVDWVDYKDVNLLRRFMSERAKIRARRVTGNDQQQQAAVARAIKVAREMALLPYSVRQVTQRSKGKGRDRGGDREMRTLDVEAVPADGAASGDAGEAEMAEMAEMAENEPGEQAVVGAADAAGEGGDDAEDVER
jgi:small subunit ribosomal protein S18